MNTPVVLHLFKKLSKKYEMRDLSRILSHTLQRVNVRFYYLCLRENANWCNYITLPLTIYSF